MRVAKNSMNSEASFQSFVRCAELAEHDSDFRRWFHDEYIPIAGRWQY